MSTNGIDTASTAAIPTTPEQLSLLSTTSVPLQFRLDERTRRAGLQHVAELRALMLAQAADRRSARGSATAATTRGRRSLRSQVAA